MINILNSYINTKVLFILATIISVLVIVYSYLNGYIIAYGDAEAHLNISKRVIHSITPGFSQLGGVWLPLPHFLTIPLVFFEPLWRSGLAGSVISGISFVVSSIFLYKLVFLVTKKQTAAFFSFLIFIINPNILYMQTTPMSEMLLITFFILSSYFFAKFLISVEDFLSLILSGLFAFLATLTRYDGWFLVFIELGILIILYLKKSHLRQKLGGEIVLYSSLAFFGITLWVLWNYMIFDNPLYFANSPFSANSQQQIWLSQGQLPAYKNIPLSLAFYSIASYKNIGPLISLMGLAGATIYIFTQRKKEFIFLIPILLAPFLLYVSSLYLGHSVIFVPELAPPTLTGALLNIRYGLMMVVPAAFLSGYLFYKSKKSLKILLLLLFLLQIGLYSFRLLDVATWKEGIQQLTASKQQDMSGWLAKNYDQGYVLMDDYAGNTSVIKSNIPMQNIIYIGNRPYWQESFEEPEKYASWIVMKKGDTLWKNIYNNHQTNERLLQYFNKMYSSEKVMIFKKKVSSNFN